MTEQDRQDLRESGLVPEDLQDGDAGDAEDVEDQFEEWMEDGGFEG